MEDIKLNLPESPVVWFTNYTGPDGFEESITIRGFDLKEVYENRKKVIDRLKEIGATPIIKNKGFAKKEVEYVPNANCPKCGGRLVIKFKKDGGKYHKCENGRYNKITGKNEGCDFVDWLNPPTTWNKQNPYRDDQGNKVQGMQIDEWESYARDYSQGQ